MPASKEMKSRAPQVQKKLVPSLTINLILPWILYMLLHRIFTNDTTSLGITTAIPVVRVLVLWLWQRKIDYIGIIGVICFIIALSVSIFFGGNPMPLKLIHPIVLGIIGTACSISVIIGKPLLMTLFRVITHGNEEHFSSPRGRKKVTIMTALFGVFSLVSSTTHIVMALMLTTGTFLIMSKIVSWITILVLLGSTRLVMPRIK